MTADKYVKRSDIIAALWNGAKVEREKYLKGEGEGRVLPSATLTSALGLIREVPNADVVEVVRCKSCTYWDNGRCEGVKNGLIREYTEPYDFCSYGKRKKEGEVQ